MMTRLEFNTLKGRRHGIILALATLFGLWAAPALAYVGPGAGLSLLSALWALLAAVGAALAFIILWPLRRMMRKRSAPSATAASATPAEPPATPEKTDSASRR